MGDTTRRRSRGRAHSRRATRWLLGGIGLAFLGVALWPTGSAALTPPAADTRAPVGSWTFQGELNGTFSKGDIIISGRFLDRSDALQSQERAPAPLPPTAPLTQAVPQPTAPPAPPTATPPVTGGAPVPQAPPGGPQLAPPAPEPQPPAPVPQQPLAPPAQAGRPGPGPSQPAVPETPQAPPAGPPASTPPPAPVPNPPPTENTLNLPISVAQPIPPQPAAPPRFQFDIDPKTPLKDLLPAPPRVKNPTGPVLGDDLSRVPEIEFQAPVTKKRDSQEATRDTAFLIARINHLNAHKNDAFVEALRGQRPDLNGLPFAMGDACRTKGERSALFTRAVATVRAALQGQQVLTQQVVQPRDLNQPRPNPVGGQQVLTQQVVQQQATAPNGPATSVVLTKVVEANGQADGFWSRYETACAQEDQAQAKVNRTHCEHVTLARIAALMQVLAPETPEVRLGLIKYLSGVAHAEATRALAKLAIFSREEEVRQAAVEALKVRRDRDYTEVLVRGLHYPFPAVAQHSADAIVQLERADLEPQLLALLDDPDPRAPVLAEVNDRKVPVVRELVRVNHHRSCLLCHSPGNTDKVGAEALTAAVPVPTEPLPSPSQGYQNTVPDITVRVDVTYLRQDFSVLEPVADAAPWPEMQRFDFLVRERTLSDDEATTFRAKLEPREAGEQSPYHRAALTALRGLTGKDTEPTAAAWKRLLKAPTQRQ